ncbi:hypothetical protein C4572_02495 [Candidatus Parcubacteria bacterium]|nr:MAG: hypothetical protein C4572_02495 [Candidatus Parcubacteria bacterium]
MSKAVITRFQPSITEWFASIGKIKESEKFRKEDVCKHQRLEILFQKLGLLYERPINFSSRDLILKTPEFLKIYNKNDLCAIRLIPKKDRLPKFRMRGLPIKKCYNDWFLAQKINYDDYVAQICPHSETLLWSISFVINDKMIFGEIIRGLHSQLTHGETESELYQFQYDYKKWRWSKYNQAAEKQVKKIVNSLKISSKGKRKVLKKLLKVKFCRDFIVGYFEATVWPDKKERLIDFNRMLPRYIKTPPQLAAKNSSKFVSGVPAFPGKTSGKAVLVNEKNISRIKFSSGNILVCDNTDVRYLPLMKKAAAIVTDRGGILTHAAIISRELKKPCIINTREATKKIESGNLIFVDAAKGIIKKL